MVRAISRWNGSPARRMWRGSWRGLLAMTEARASSFSQHWHAWGTFGEWAYVGFKGGSEPGVVNFSWLLRDVAGVDHVLVMSWNDPAQRGRRNPFLGFAQQILREASGGLGN